MNLRNLIKNRLKEQVESDQTEAVDSRKKMLERIVQGLNISQRHGSEFEKELKSLLKKYGY